MYQHMHDVQRHYTRHFRYMVHYNRQWVLYISRTQRQAKCASVCACVCVWVRVHVCVYECVYPLPLDIFLDDHISYAIQTSRTHSGCHELDDRQNAPTSFPHIWAPTRCNCCRTALRLSSLPTLGASNIWEITFGLITLSAFIRAPWALLLWVLCCMLQWALWWVLQCAAMWRGHLLP